MQVKTLIRLLQDQPQDAEVKVLHEDYNHFQDSECWYGYVSNVESRASDVEDVIMVVLS